MMWVRFLQKHSSPEVCRDWTKSFEKRIVNTYKRHSMAGKQLLSGKSVPFMVQDKNAGHVQPTFGKRGNIHKGGIMRFEC